MPDAMNEAETRAEHSDPALQLAGWGVVEGSRVLSTRRSHALSLEQDLASLSVQGTSLTEIIGSGLQDLKAFAPGTGHD